MKIGKKKLIATMLLMLLFSVLCGNSAKADVHSIDPVSYTHLTMVTMHIKLDTELRLESLEQTQAEQDEVLAELLGGEV